MPRDIQPSQSSMTLDLFINDLIDINETHLHKLYLDLHIVNDSS